MRVASFWHARATEDDGGLTSGFRLSEVTENEMAFTEDLMGQLVRLGPKGA
jgi:hypothetical protein